MKRRTLFKTLAGGVAAAVGIPAAKAAYPLASINPQAATVVTFSGYTAPMAYIKWAGKTYILNTEQVAGLNQGEAVALEELKENPRPLGPSASFDISINDHGS